MSEPALIPEILEAAIGPVLRPIPQLTPVQKWLAGGRRARSRDTYIRALRSGLRAVGLPDDPFAFAWHNVTEDQALVWSEALRRKYAPRTQAKINAGIRGVLGTCRKMKFGAPLDLENAIDAFIGDKIHRERFAMQIPPEDHYQAVFDVCRDGSARGLRDLVILA
ncbi:unnamed protein product, partial [marine sediment metagenome]